MKRSIFLLIALSFAMVTSAQMRFEETLLVSYNDYLYSQDLDSASCRYVATGYLDIINKTSGKNVLLLKWKDTPGYQWVNHYSGPGNLSDIGRHIMKTDDGNFLVSGTTNSFSSGAHYDAFTMKLNSSGSILWMNYWGGSWGDISYSSCENDSAYFVAGRYNISSTDGYTNGFICAFNKSTGNLIWGKKYGTSHNVYYTNYFSIIIGHDGYLYATGTSNSSTTQNMLVTKVNPLNGSVVTNNRYNCSGRKLIGLNIAKGHSSSYIITGYCNKYSYYKVLLMNIDSNLNIAWTKMYYRSGTNDIGIQVMQCDTGYVVYGVTKSFGSDDVFLLHTASNGGNHSVHYYHGSPGNEGSGSFREPGTALLYLPDSAYAMVSGKTDASGYLNSYLLRTDQYAHTGCELDTTFMDSTLTVVVYEQAVVSSDLSVTDSTMTRYTLSPVWDTICEPDSIDSLDLKSYSLAQHAVTDPQVMVYPNPTTSQLHFAFSSTKPGAEVRIYNISGTLMLSTVKAAHEGNLSVDVSGLPSGVYYAVITQNNYRQYCKIIKTH